MSYENTRINFVTFIHNNNNSGHNHTRPAIFSIRNINLRNISEGILLLIAEE